MRTVRASQILQLGKPTADPVSDSHSWKWAGREGSMWGVAYLPLSPLSAFLRDMQIDPVLTTLILHMAGCKMQQQGDMQLSIIFLLMTNFRWLSAIQSPALRFTGYLLIPHSFLLGLIPWMWLEWLAGAGPREQYDPFLRELLLQHFYPSQTDWCGGSSSPQTPLYLLMNSLFLLADWTTTMYNFCILLIVILIF